MPTEPAHLRFDRADHAEPAQFDQAGALRRLGTRRVDLTDALTLKSITAYRKLKTDDYIDIDATQYQVGDVFVGVNQNQFSQEFQLDYNRASGSRAVAGLYYLKEHITSHQEAYADDLLGPLFLNSGFLRTIDDDLTTKSYAAYANASYESCRRVRLSAGIRYTSETKDYFRTTRPSSRCCRASTVRSSSPGAGQVERFSPMVSIDWQVDADDDGLCARRQGLQIGRLQRPRQRRRAGPNTSRRRCGPTKPGFKTTLANQLRLNGAVFYNDYRLPGARQANDRRSRQASPVPVLSVINAGKLRIQGAELEAAWTAGHEACCSTPRSAIWTPNTRTSTTPASRRRQPRVPDAGLLRRSGPAVRRANMRTGSAAPAASRSAARRVTVRARRSPSITR